MEGSGNDGTDAGVQPHPDLHLLSTGEFVIGQRPLRFHCRRYRGWGRREHGEERIPLCSNRYSTGVFDGLAYQFVVSLDDGPRVAARSL